MSALALLFGLISIVCALFTPFLISSSVLVYVAPISGIVGVVLAIQARKVEKSTATSAGLFLSILGIILSLILTLSCMVCYKGCDYVRNNAFMKSAKDEITDTAEKFKEQNADVINNLGEQVKKVSEEVKKQYDEKTESK